MSLILVDIGNSAIKLSFVPSPIADSVGSSLDSTCEKLRINDWSEFDFKTLPKTACAWVIACVNNTKLNELSDQLDQAGRIKDQIQSVRWDKINLKIDVDQPDAVGIDRLVGCLAASQGLAEDEAAIVVDAGTAVTIDLVTGGGVFRGGVIYPGVNASCFQLNQQTAALPRLDYFARKEILAAWQSEATQLAAGKTLPPWQRNTATAIIAGIYQVQLAGLTETVSRFKNSLPSPLSSNCRILLTGGGIEELLSAGRILNCQPEWIDKATSEPNLIHAGLLSIHHRNLVASFGEAKGDYKTKNERLSCFLPNFSTSSLKPSIPFKAKGFISASV